MTSPLQNDPWGSNACGQDTSPLNWYPVHHLCLCSNHSSKYRAFFESLVEVLGGNLMREQGPKI